MLLGMFFGVLFNNRFHPSGIFNNRRFLPGHLIFIHFLSIISGRNSHHLAEMSVEVAESGKTRCFGYGEDRMIGIAQQTACIHDPDIVKVSQRTDSHDRLEGSAEMCLAEMTKLGQMFNREFCHIIIFYKTESRCDRDRTDFRSSRIYV